MNTPDILYEDQAVIVCRKQAGIPVQTAAFGRQDMESLLKNYRAGKKEEAAIFVVHRLDQPVEGVMVFAKDKKAAAALSGQLQQGSIDKHYLAVTEGCPQLHEASLIDWLLKDPRTNTSEVVPAGTKGAKQARLSYRLLEKTADKALLEIHLETGRHHQIRVQMAHAGYPLVGDKKYNPNCQTGYLPIALCSVRLAFLHPIDGQKKEFSLEPSGEGFLSLHK